METHSRFLFIVHVRLEEITAIETIHKFPCSRLLSFCAEPRVLPRRRYWGGIGSITVCGSMRVQVSSWSCGPDKLQRTCRFSIVPSLLLRLILSREQGNLIPTYNDMYSLNSLLRTRQHCV